MYMKLKNRKEFRIQQDIASDISWLSESVWVYQG